MGSQRRREGAASLDGEDWTKDRESVARKYHEVVPYAPDYDLRNEAESTHELSPSLPFTTHHGAMKAFALVLQALSEAGFEHVDGYSGPRLGIERSRGDPPHISEAVAAIRAHRDAKVPWGGLMARVTYGPSKGTRAKVVVRGSGPARVRIKVKGPVRRSDWNRVRRLVKERLGAV